VTEDACSQFDFAMKRPRQFPVAALSVSSHFSWQRSQLSSAHQNVSGWHGLPQWVSLYRDLAKYFKRPGGNVKFDRDNLPMRACTAKFAVRLLPTLLLAGILGMGPAIAAEAGRTAQRFDDFQGINAVLKQYLVAIDTLDENLYGTAFAEQDAVFEIRDVIRHGREDIKKEVTGDKEARTARIAKGEDVPPLPTTWHFMSGSNIVFLAKNRAKHNAYYQVWTRQNDHPGGIVRLTTPITMVAIGRYDDDLVKVNGKWFIQRRKVTPDTSGGF
jgi:SnoaL-like domain